MSAFKSLSYLGSGIKARGTYINGDTFPVREALKSEGCMWDPVARAWRTETVEEAKSVVDAFDQARSALRGRRLAQIENYDPQKAFEETMRKYAQANAEPKRHIGF